MSISFYSSATHCGTYSADLLYVEADVTEGEALDLCKSILESVNERTKVDLIKDLL